MSEERFDRIEQRLDRLDGRFDKMATRLDGRIDELGLQMRVLHEDVLARIAAIPEYTGPTKAEMDQGFADLKEAIFRRADPLEATARQHSGRLDRLEQERN